MSDLTDLQSKLPTFDTSKLPSYQELLAARSMPQAAAPAPVPQAPMNPNAPLSETPEGKALEQQLFAQMASEGIPQGQIQASWIGNKLYRGDANAAREQWQKEKTAESDAAAKVRAANKEDALGNLGNFVLTLGDSALLGIPGAITSKVAPEAMKKFEDWKKKHEVLSTLGDVGGAFVPGVGLAGKGLKAAGGLGKTAIEGLDAANAVTEAGKLATAPNTLEKVGGALEKFQAAPTGGFANYVGRGVQEGAIRGATNAMEENNPDVVGSAVTGGLFGGAGGLLGGGIAKLGHTLSEAQNSAAKSVLKNTTGMTNRQMANVVNTLTKTESLGNRINATDDIANDLATWMTGNNRLGIDIAKAPEGTADDYLHDIWKTATKTMDDADEAILASNPMVKKKVWNGDSATETSQEIHPVLGLIQNNRPVIIQDIARYLESGGQKGSPELIYARAQDAFDNIFNSVDNQGSLVAIKRRLNGIENESFKKANRSSDPTISDSERADFVATRRIQYLINQNVQDLLKASGKNKLAQDLIDSQRDYKYLEVVAPAIMKNEAKFADISGGSSTAEKQQVFKIFDSASEGKTADIGKSIGQLIGASTVGKFANAAIPQQISRAQAASYGALKKLNASALKKKLLGEGVPSDYGIIGNAITSPTPLGRPLGATMAGVAGQLGAGLAANQPALPDYNPVQTAPGIPPATAKASDPIQTAQAQLPGYSPAAQAIATGSPMGMKAYNQLSALWDMKYKPFAEFLYQMPEAEAKRQFMESALRMIAFPGGTKIDPAKAANVIFWNEDDKKQAQEMIAKVRQMEENMDDAMKAYTGGSVPILNSALRGLHQAISPDDPKIQTAKASLIKNFAETAKIPESQADGIVNQILARGGTTEQKSAMLINAMSVGNPKAAYLLNYMGYGNAE